MNDITIKKVKKLMAKKDLTSKDLRTLIIYAKFEIDEWQDFIKQCLKIIKLPKK